MTSELDVANAATRKFLGLAIDTGARTGQFSVHDAIVNPRGTLFGGAAIGMAVDLIEAVTERRALWTTMQFVSTPVRDDVIDLQVEELARGGRMSQVRVTGSVDGVPVFMAMGASGIARDDVTATFDQMPVVSPPEACPPHTVTVGGEVDRSYFAHVDRRIAAEAEALRGTASHAAYWVRVPGMRVTAPLLGYFGDVAAFGVFRALGRPDGRATSIDNTLRMAPDHETEWVLLDLRTQFVAGGYGHATVDLWAQDGTLLGLMSQSVAMRTMV